MKKFRLNTFMIQCMQQIKALSYLLVLFFSLQQAQALETGLHYYLIQNAETAQVIRRDTAGSNGVTFNNVFLAPNTRYKAWLLQAETSKTASIEFTMPGNGRQLSAPTFFLAASSSPDFDNDGLHEDGEFIMGTSATESDTDGDGILDGAEVKQGTNPLDGKPVRTGIIGTADTPGTAVAICALNDIAAVADSTQGISVFNVFNGMQPLLIAQVNTPGNAVDVACTGDRIAVADSQRGIAIVDIEDPSTAKIIHQIELGNVASLTVEGNLIYAALETRSVAVIDMNTGTEVSRLQINEVIDDINIAGDYLYVLGANKLYVYSTFTQGLILQGSLVLPGSRPPANRRALFVGGDVAYVGLFTGYSTIDISDPSLPQLIALPPTAQSPVHEIIANGSGLVLAVNSLGSPSTRQVGLFDATDVNDVTQLLTSFDTPAQAQQVAIYNGIAYVADAGAGLQVLNYQAYDAFGIIPSISLSTGGDTGDVVAGQFYRLSAEVNDDVQVRNVEFYVDGIKVATDGNYPFEVRILAPALSQQTSIIVKARASDTGGNFTWTDEIVLGISPDNISPKVAKLIPADGKIIGSLNTVTAIISEPIDPLAVDNNLLTLLEAGIDTIFGTADDQIILDGEVSFSDASLLLSRNFASPLQPGLYQATISEALLDFSGNALEAPVSWQFTIYDVGADRDADGVPDALEQALGLDPDKADSDGNGTLDGDEDFDIDGLGNADEVILGFDATNPDSDGDGVNDGLQDSDQDGITDVDEVLTVGSDRFDPDTDDDGVNDGVENLFGSDLQDPDIVPVSVSTNKKLVASGERVMIDIVVSNLSESVLSDVFVTLNVPVGYQLNESRDVNPDPHFNSCRSSNINDTCLSGHKIIWQLGVLGSGKSQTIQLNALIDDNLLDDTEISTPVIVEAMGMSDSIGVFSTLTVKNNPVAELELNVSQDPVASGENFSLLLDMGNISATILSDVQLRLKLPAGVTVETISDGGSVEAATGDILWSQSSVAAGSVIHREVQLTADANLVDGRILASRLELRHGSNTETVASSEEVITVAADAALTATLAASPNPVTAGGQLNYAITVSNSSAASVDNVLVLYRVPQGISFIEGLNTAPDPHRNSCRTTNFNDNCVAGHEVFWELGTLIAGESRTITISSAVAADRVNGQLITTPIVVSGTGIDSISLERTVQVQNNAVAELELNVSQDPVAPGENFSLLLDMGNISVTALSEIQLRLKLPAGVTVGTISDGGSVEAATGNILWSQASVAAGSVIHREVQLTVDANLDDGRILVSRLELRHGSNSETVASSEGVVTVAANAALTATLAASPNPVAAGGQLNYAITVSNTSAASVDNVWVLYRVPQGISFIEDSNTAPDPHRNSCRTTNFNDTCVAGHEVFWELGTLTAGESRTITISSAVDADRVSGQLITAPIVVSGTGIDSISLERTVQVQNNAVAELELNASQDPVAPGENFSLLLDMGNISATVLSDVQLRLKLPAGVSVATISDGGSVEAVTGDILWNQTSVAAGSVLHRDVQLTADTGLVDGRILASRLELRHGGSTETAASSEEVVTVAANAALTATLAASPNPVTAGGQLNYVITVSNTSAALVDNVWVLYRVPRGISFIENLNTAPDPHANSCINSNGNNTCTAGHEVFWELGTLAAGESQTITIDSNVAADMQDGQLITTPIVVSGTGIDSISLKLTVQIQN